MGKLTPVYEFPKVAVVGDEYSLFPLGDGQDVIIAKRVGIVVGNGSHIMPLLLKESGQSELGTFVQQELHIAFRRRRRVSAAAFRRSSRSTRARA